MDLWTLSDLCTPWCIHVAATLRVADHILAGNAEIEQLAAACGADAGSLQRLLRHLVSKGIFEEPAAGRFAVNEAARGFLDPSTFLGFNLEGIGGRMAYAWSTLLKAVRTGKPAYTDVFGRDFWQDLEAHPAISSDFDALMGPAGHGAPDPEVFLDPGHWNSVRTVVDVGGGTGALLAAVLKARPAVRGILVDLPRTVARAGATFGEAGVSDRVTLAGQSFFDHLPGGHDLYLLKNVLADWPDPEAQLLLRRCAEAAGPSGRVMILGGVALEEPPSPELLMLMLVGGKKRSLAEFGHLAQGAGLQIVASGRQPSGRFIVECGARG